MNNFKDLLVTTQNLLGFAYWIEVTTEIPACTYYFGPFQTQQEAEAAQGGYEEDLKAEAAQGIHSRIEQCKPKFLTSPEEVGEMTGQQTPFYSSLL
ncbi:DUF1816 domain-containing protein [Roseofilum casamattae]|uniref:DUF1816 domain-containing protein n=1 Tax=Roseofilum casamattae BLCC-M143 TaxID=3022442 RepID=A0ABT7BXI6_9CYAN|nr:DUF1816 domain-containing protein [Roseofilum casamattae]MDJ1183897.1 DUF1816 domain-containing protein [Roseofilum casamattae BLCC-M143]